MGRNNYSFVCVCSGSLLERVHFSGCEVGWWGGGGGNNLLLYQVHRQVDVHQIFYGMYIVHVTFMYKYCTEHDM